MNVRVRGTGPLMVKYFLISRSCGRDLAWGSVGKVVIPGTGHLGCRHPVLVTWLLGRWRDVEEYPVCTRATPSHDMAEIEARRGGPVSGGTDPRTCKW